MMGVRRPPSDDEDEDAWSGEDASSPRKHAPPTPKPALPKQPDNTARLAAERAAVAAAERAAGDKAAAERAVAERAAVERAAGERAAAETAAAERVGAAAPSTGAVDPQLKRNIEDQLERLLTQLDDIEGLQDELSAEEYASMKQVLCHTRHPRHSPPPKPAPTHPPTRLSAYPLTRLSAYPPTSLPAYPPTRLPAYPSQDTLTQLTEFQESLKQMTAGNMSLQSAFEATRQAVRAAISQAFKTPEVIRLFAKKEPVELRKRLANIDRDVKLGKIEFATVSAQVPAQRVSRVACET